MKGQAKQKLLKLLPAHLTTEIPNQEVPPAPRGGPTDGAAVQPSEDAELVIPTTSLFNSHVWPEPNPGGSFSQT